MIFDKTTDQMNAEKILEAARKKEIADALASGKTPDGRMLHDALITYSDYKTAKRIIDRMKLDPTVSPLQATFDYASKFLGKNWVQDLRAAARTDAPNTTPHASVRRTDRSFGM